MIYRIVLKVGYCEAWFDFETIEGAADFARDILAHQVASEDTKRGTSISIEILNTVEEEAN